MWSKNSNLLNCGGTILICGFSSELACAYNPGPITGRRHEFFDQTGRIAGCYTLSASLVAVGDLPADIWRKLPRYPVVPAVRLGRLAVDQTLKGRGLGSALLFDAAMRALRADIAAFAMVVDAKDEKAAAFYRHHGFLDLSTDGQTLFIALARLAERLANSR